MQKILASATINHLRGLAHQSVIETHGTGKLHIAVTAATKKGEGK